MAEPTTVTIPGAAAGNNGLLSVAVYGSRAVRVEKIRYGVSIYSLESESANARSFYPNTVLEASFSLILLHVSAAERDDFNDWMRGYMTGVLSGKVAQGYMLVQVPGRRVARKGVPVGPLAYGDSIQQAGQAYRSAVQFIGTTDPMSTSAVSSFKAATNDTDKVTPNFYPSGTQVSGAESLAGTIFDTSTPVDPNSPAYASRLAKVDQMLGTDQ